MERKVESNQAIMKCRLIIMMTGLFVMGAMIVLFLTDLLFLDQTFLDLVYAMNEAEHDDWVERIVPFLNE